MVASCNTFRTRLGWLLVVVLFTPTPNIPRNFVNTFRLFPRGTTCSISTSITTRTRLFHHKYIARHFSSCGAIALWVPVQLNSWNSSTPSFIWSVLSCLQTDHGDQSIPLFPLLDYAGVLGWGRSLGICSVCCMLYGTALFLLYSNVT